ncbi:MAG: helix-turn-helix domain-containing protein [Flavobacterium sp.]|jgi:chromosomal replication initiator protein
MNYFIVPGLKIRTLFRKKAKVASYDPKIVIDVIVKYFNTDFEAISSRRKFGYIVEQRHSLQYILMRYTKLSCKAIGEMFGQDHSTILHARNTVINELDSVLENNFKKFIPELLNKIRYEIKEIGEVSTELQ